MSLRVEHLIYCDMCGENENGRDRTESTYKIRKGRKSLGWKVGPPKDYCPECWAKRRVK